MAKRRDMRWLGLAACFVSTLVVSGLAGLVFSAAIAAAGGR
jgi:hypothetical protein